MTALKMSSEAGGALASADDPGWRLCPKCGETKPGGHFNRHKRQCKECRAANQRNYVANNRETVAQRCREYNARTNHERHRALMDGYGITLAQYEEMLESQGFCCAICRGDVVGRDGRSGPVDHCHETGIIRGVLCTRCNVGIAQFRDNPDHLASAIAYLARVQDH